MSKASSNTDITAKLSRLDELVAWFEGDDFTLEQAIDTFTEATKLTEEIKADLSELKNKITVVKKQFDKE